MTAVPRCTQSRRGSHSVSEYKFNHIMKHINETLGSINFFLELIHAPNRKFFREVTLPPHPCNFHPLEPGFAQPHCSL